MDNRTALTLGHAYRRLTQQIAGVRSDIAHTEDALKASNDTLAELIAAHEAIETDVRAAGKAEYLEEGKRP